MDLALYHPTLGYYARAARRSGRSGDFYTSVDVGPLFGRLLAIQIAEMLDIVAARGACDLSFVEAGAGNGRLARDILQAIRRGRPDLFRRVRAHLCEISSAARDAQRSTLGDLSERSIESAEGLPDRFDGVLVANELLDALPCHQVGVDVDGTLREVYVDLDQTDGALVARTGPPSTGELAAHLRRIGVSLEPGWRAEINLRAVEWIRDVARRIGTGFVLLIDYGHSAVELYSAGHADGTITSFRRHVSEGTDDPRRTGRPQWLAEPGEHDITAHVDFTSIQLAAASEGLMRLGLLDQTYFLMALLTAACDVEGPRADPAFASPADSLQMDLNAMTLDERLALKTLTIPGGLGSTFKVLILGKGVGTPALRGCSCGTRVT
jgi:SAM-dependent MidA family methyltransferase